LRGQRELKVTQELKGLQGLKEDLVQRGLKEL
jgi:hypothetical protein